MFDYADGVQRSPVVGLPRPVDVLMDATETVAIGAVALAILCLQSLNSLSALHLVAPLQSVYTWTILAGRLGWIRCGTSGSYNLRMIRFVTCKNTLINLTFVRSKSALEFVPRGPETALVNFVCPSGVFCGYPSLTFNKVTFALQDNQNGFRNRTSDVSLNRDRGQTIDRSHYVGRTGGVSKQHVPRFFSLLTETNAVVVGALPLTMLGLLSWDPSKELVVYCPIQEKRKWVRRFGWRLYAEKKGSDSENGIDCMQQFLSTSGNTINMVYVRGPRVLDVLARAPETALSTCLTGSTLVVAYPLMTLNRQTFTVVMTGGGHVVGGECLDDFVPVALADRMPRGYVGVRSWGDELCMRFEYGMSWPADLSPLIAGFTWDLSAT
ncbi:hypothetical protein K435DRAFT_798995 [Dendrothele bispora CBS 962.96]|uniref:Uncharacterized protein n=1 Tax=Dendrothele bispora (strain CBS 962.96) TaxID=1314807 RepID=A0A4V4HFB6_DENBC|nr:hypothetical protein K435DRAFT_798995 [Dendrothele bispora CBS 962.96]